MKKKTLRFGLLVMFLGLAVGCQTAPAETEVRSSSPINGQIAFCGRKENDERFDIYLVDLTTREWLNLTEEYVLRIIDNSFGNSIGCDDDMRPYRVGGVEWSPGGDLLIVDAGGPYLAIPYILNISENGNILGIVQQWPRPWPNLNIFEHPMQFSWSSNGEKVAFVGLNGSDGYSNLFIGDVSDWMNSNSNTAMVQVTKEYRDFPGVIFAPSWSPVGESVAVSLNGPASGIAIFSADGTQSVYVTNDTSEQLSFVDNPSPWVDFPSAKPSWFPDGESVIFVAASKPNDRTSLFKVEKDGRNLTL